MTTRLPRNQAVLAQVDHAILAALLTHKVLTTDQVAQVCARAVRTARLRLDRLHRARLVDRLRPYVEVGSAPAHWWLTTGGQALAGGTGRIRRDRPHPYFLAHIAATAAVPLTLAAHGPAAGLTLVSWVRDEDAWEPYPDEAAVLAGRPWPTIKPDGLARIVVGTRADLPLPVLVEVDRATSAVVRLRAKVPRYLDYADLAAWKRRHPACPALLLLTPAAGRAEAFLAAAATYRKGHWTGGHRDMLVGASAALSDPRGMVIEPVWRTSLHGAPVTLRELLAEHLAGIDAARGANERQPVMTREAP